MSNDNQITRRTLLGLGGAAALGSPLRGLAGPLDAPKPAAVKVEKDVVIGKGGNIDLHVDIYRPPAGTEKRMALIHLHGGGFARGSKDTLGPQVTPITARGYVSVTAQYRLSGEAKWPAQREDVQTAIRWTRENAAVLGIDPQRIAVVGYSAGGHLALFAAGAADMQLAACVAFYPVAEITKEAPWTPALMPAGSNEATMRAASPTTYIKARFPPTIVYHGLADVTVSPESSLHLLQLFREAGVSSELHTFAGVPHVFDSHPEFADTCAALTDFFLDRQVLNPRTYPPFGGGAAGGGPGAGGGPTAQ
jgi:acetyl esterase/lipase